MHLFVTFSLREFSHMSLESVRDEVKYALTCQPGELSPAINGDGDTIVKLSFFARKVPPAWLDEISTKLYEEHTLCERDCSYDEEGTPSYKPSQVAKGVYLLRFHEWVARKVREVDSKYVPGNHYNGRGMNAQAIQQALAAWI